MFSEFHCLTYYSSLDRSLVCQPSDQGTIPLVSPFVSKHFHSNNKFMEQAGTEQFQDQAKMCLLATHLGYFHLVKL